MVVVSWQAPGVAPREATTEVSVRVDPGVAEKLRWYLEDYAEFPAAPAPAIAAETEQIVVRVGRELFAAVFGAGDAAAIWAQASLGSVDRLRVEVDADPSDVPGLPWELLREPGTDRPLVVAVGQFVRTHRQAAITIQVPKTSQTRLRVLLVICRPGGGEDVAFRSVASRLVRGGAEQLPGLDLDVLRPPTFVRLGQVLREAADQGQPYHVVHFDGHGTYLDVEHLDTESSPADGVAVSPLRYGPSLAAPARPGRHGYLLFEKPDSGFNQQLVDGPTLAGLLVATQVPVLVLNACRSAYAEAPDMPDTADTRAGVHDRIRAYGSLAAEVADAGVPGVVAMRYNIYVVTAAQFVADLYTALLAGHSLGRAATAARQALAADPTRHIGTNPVALQDWVVPTVYETIPLTLLTRQDGQPAVRITLPQHDTPGVLAEGVPPAPDVGFFGRDESLLALDRAFDEHRIVLLHALAGAGKSSTAAEFARWYAATGGLDGPQAGAVLWTSFEHHLPLARVLDVVGTAFAPLMAANGIEWAAVTDPAKRRGLVVQVLVAVPVLWVWDNVEPVAGFPEGTRSTCWSAAEQQELAGFLRELKTKSRAKMLLTSRRTEDSWLGGVAVRVALPPMPMRERLQLAHALVRHLVPDTAQDVDWRALLRFTGGNPLTITVTVRQALRERVASIEEVARFVARVRAGLASLEAADDAALGREQSLAASLAYGFSHAFTTGERARLAVLHLFRDTVNAGALLAMGNPVIAVADAVPVLAGADEDGMIGLLDRAVDVGLLTGYGGGYYGIHPALPWFFTGLFTDHIGAPGTPTAAVAERAYARVYGALGGFYAGQVHDGRSAEVLPVLRVEESNLTYALELARAHQLPEVGLGCLIILSNLYDLTGRNVEWARLVGEIEGDYIDPATDRPLPGREEEYAYVMTFRVRIAHERRDWPTATRLHTARTAWARDRASPYLKLPAEHLDSTARRHINELISSEHDLGRLLREQDDPACVDHFQAAYDLFERIGSSSDQASCASGLGTAYLRVSGLRDLDQAQYWFERNLDLMPEHDQIGRAASYGYLANVAYERAFDVGVRGGSVTELVAHLNTAHIGYQRALDLLPADHHRYRAVMHHHLGNIRSLGDMPQALHHLQQGIQHMEAYGNTHGAGLIRYNIAWLLNRDGRSGDALHYARAALDNYRDVGPSATTEAQQAQALISDLEQKIKGHQTSSATTDPPAAGQRVQGDAP